MRSIDRENCGGSEPEAVGRKPWVSPTVILSDPLSSARQDNKGLEDTPDIKLSSTSTS